MPSLACLSPRDQTFQWKTCNLQIHLVSNENYVLPTISPPQKTLTVSEPGSKRRKRKERKRRQKERKAALRASSQTHDSEDHHSGCVLICVCGDESRKETKNARKKRRKAASGSHPSEGDHTGCVLVCVCSLETSQVKRIPRSRKRRIIKRNKKKFSGLASLTSLIADNAADAMRPTTTNSSLQSSRATLLSEVSILRGASSNSPQSPVSRSRSPPPTNSRSPPRTPRSSRTHHPRSPRVASPSPARDPTQHRSSPRQSRIDTPTRRRRNETQRIARVQYPCRNHGCRETFRMCRQRNIHENSSCSRASQHQVRFFF